ncbi:MAG: hypothetical protein ABI878_01630 [Acidobacteriota bacterium]
MLRRWDEFFGGPNVPSEGRVHVTLNANGVILLNPKAFEKLGSPETAVLLYDRRNETIGLRQASADTLHAFPVKPKLKFRHWLIHARPFCRHHKLRVERTIAFPDANTDTDGTLLLDLHTSIEIGRPGHGTK